jgi:hypothetical protein
VSLRDRVRWLAVPIAAYLAITLGLPIANGAAGREDFLIHAATVVAGCVLVVAAIAAAGAGFEFVRMLANRRRTRRVLLSGGHSS